MAGCSELPEAAALTPHSSLQGRRLRPDGPQHARTSLFDGWYIRLVEPAGRQATERNRGADRDEAPHHTTRKRRESASWSSSAPHADRLALVRARRGHRGGTLLLPGDLAEAVFCHGGVAVPSGLLRGDASLSAGQLRLGRRARRASEETARMAACQARGRLGDDSMGAPRRPLRDDRGLDVVLDQPCQSTTVPRRAASGATRGRRLPTRAAVWAVWQPVALCARRHRRARAQLQGGARVARRVPDVRVRRRDRL